MFPEVILFVVSYFEYLSCVEGNGTLPRELKEKHKHDDYNEWAKNRLFKYILEQELIFFSSFDFSQVFV